MISSLFLGIVLINLGVVAGSWLRGQIEQRRLSHVLQYDRESGMWKEVKEGERISLDETIIIGYALYPPPSE